MKNRALVFGTWLLWYMGLTTVWSFGRSVGRWLSRLPQRVLRLAKAIHRRMFQPTWEFVKRHGISGFALRATKDFVDWLRMIKALWLLEWIVRVFAVVLIVAVAIPVIVLIGVALLIRWFFYDKVVWPFMKLIGRGIKWFFYDKIVWPFLKLIGRGIRWFFYDKVVWPLLKWVGRGIRWFFYDKVVWPFMKLIGRGIRWFFYDKVVWPSMKLIGRGIKWFFYDKIVWPFLKLIGRGIKRTVLHPIVRVVLGLAVLVLTVIGIIPLLGLVAVGAVGVLIVLGVLATFAVRFGVWVGNLLWALMKRVWALAKMAWSLLATMFRLVFNTVPLPALPFVAIWTIRPRRSWGKLIVATVVVAVVAVSIGGVWGYQSGRLDIFSDRDDAIDYAFSSDEVAKLSESVRLVQVVWGDLVSGQVFFVRSYPGVVTSNREIVVSTEAFEYQLTQQEVDQLNASIEAGELVLNGPISILGAAVLPSFQDRVQQPEIIDLSVQPAVHSELAVMSLRRGRVILDVTPAKFMAIEDKIEIGAKLFTVDMYEIPGVGYTEARVSQRVVESVFNNFVFFSDGEFGQPVFVVRDGEPELIGITSMELDGMSVVGNVNPHLAGFFARLGIEVDITRLHK